MLRWFYAFVHLLIEAQAARRDARIRLLMAQVEILRRKLGGNRVIPSPADRIRLLSIGAELDHKIDGVLGIVTAKTYYRWVQEQAEGRESLPVGRKKVVRSVRELITRLATENAGWGYKRIVGELRKLRLLVSRTTVQNILREVGQTPSPQRRSRAEETVWRKFIRLHMNTMVACDFFTKSIITPLGTKLAYQLMFIHLGTRRVFVSPPTYFPTDGWVQQQGRNVMASLVESQLEARFLIHDRDTKFTLQFDRLLRSRGVRCVRSPKLAPDANAFAESWIGRFKHECLNHFLCFGIDHLAHITREYVRFHNRHRPHQGLGNVTPEAVTSGLPPPASACNDVGPVRCQRFLGGLMRHYYRAAA